MLSTRLLRPPSCTMGTQKSGKEPVGHVCVCVWVGVCVGGRNDEGCVKMRDELPAATAHRDE